MNIVDKNYLDCADKILLSGTHKKTRSGNTVSQFGLTMKFSLQEGFPLLTTKKMYWKGIVTELLWFLKGSTNIKYLVDNNVHIWDDDAYRFYKERGGNLDKEIFLQNLGHPDKTIPHYITGDLGKIYGYMWRHSEVIKDNVVFVKRKYYQDNYVDNSQSSHTPEHKLFGAGYLGNITKEHKKLHYYKRAHSLWRNMLQRCYDYNCRKYPLYGGKGMRVSKKWHNFSLFLEDLSKLPFFYEWERNYNYDIDNDYYGSGYYSNETSIFVPNKLNKILEKLYPVSYNNEMFLTIEDLCEQYHFSVKKVFDFLKNNNKNSKYAAIKEIFPPFDHVVRFKINHTDQVKSIISKLKNNPDDRRLIVNAYNVNELDDIALPPCHVMFQFYSRLMTRQERINYIINNNIVDINESNDIDDNVFNLYNVPTRTLSCLWYQRSCDWFLGIPFNIASYALLTHMIAQCVNMDVDELVFYGGDCHIYEPHIESIKKQLKRTGNKLPTLNLNKSIKNIDEFTISDIHLTNYNPDAPLSAPLLTGL